MKTPLFVLLTLGFLLLQTAPAAEPPVHFPAYQHPVMMWVPPYGIPEAKTRLAESYDGIGPKDALTHLSLQFWIPTTNGSVVITDKYHSVTDADIAGFRNWGRTNGVRVMLCVYNSTDKWDWDLARAAFGEHRQAFVAALIAEVKRTDLDGVDIDLEGNGKFDGDQAAYVQFIRELSAGLHALGKHLTVDSFSYRWNAPNQGWWPELFPLVDGLTSMGYERIGSQSPEWRSYAAQKAVAGADAPKLMLGMPGSLNNWQERPLLDHVNWVQADGGVGVSVWDARLKGSDWHKRPVWEQLQKVRDGRKD